MAYYPYSVPDEIISFIEVEFQRFEAPLPSPKAMDHIADFVLTYIAEKNYYPQFPEEIIQRYHMTPGLSEPEKLAFIGPLEYHLKVQLRENITFDQLHLAVWASLFYCWSKEGEKHVDWFRRHEVGKKYTAPLSIRAN